jgi:hypothetical protein
MGNRDVAGGYRSVFDVDGEHPLILRPTPIPATEGRTVPTSLVRIILYFLVVIPKKFW